jgi:hypothetical protein
LSRFRSFRLSPPSCSGSPINEFATPSSFISPITRSTRAACAHPKHRRRPCYKLLPHNLKSTKEFVNL